MRWTKSADSAATYTQYVADGPVCALAAVCGVAVTSAAAAAARTQMERIHFSLDERTSKETTPERLLLWGFQVAQ